MNRNLYLIAAMLFIVISLPAAVHAKIGTPVYRTPAGPGQPVTFEGEWISGFTSYRVAVSATGSPTSGSLTVEVRGGIGDFSALSETIDLTAPRVMLIQGPVEAIRFTPSNFDGQAYTIEVLGWR
jgi:hypothetical protein